MRKTNKEEFQTGFKIILSIFDRIKFKFRWHDFDDTFGYYYYYYLSFKIFNFERVYSKHKHRGKVSKVRIRYGA